MAGAQLARSRAPETMDEFVARRHLEHAQRNAHYAAGHDRWSASTRTGQNLSAARPSDVVVLGAYGSVGRSSPAQAAVQVAAGTRYGSLYAPPPNDVAELRRQQAEFRATRREIADQNSWMAVPALAPVAVGVGLGGAAALGGRGVAAAAPALTFLAREAWQRGLEQAPRALTKNAKDALREQARIIFERTNGISAKKMGGQVHHIDPLEWAHLKPNADPNRLANLAGLPDKIHPIATAAWGEFRRSLNGRVPTHAELMRAKLRIERLVEPYALRPGASRPLKLPPKGSSQ